MSIAELSREDPSTVAPLEAEIPVQSAVPVELAIVVPTLNERDRKSVV